MDVTEEDMSTFTSLDWMGYKRVWGHREQNWYMRTLYSSRLTSLRDYIANTDFRNMGYEDVKKILPEMVKYIRSILAGRFDLDPQTIDFMKTIQVLNKEFVFPTFTGLPIKVQSRSFAHLGLKAEVNVSVITKSLVKRMVDMIYRSTEDDWKLDLYSKMKTR